MAAKAQEISQEAGSKMAAAMKDVVNAAAGIAGFAIESARDLVQYMVRRGQMTQEEADKLIREAEAFQGKRKPSGLKPPASASSISRIAPPAVAPRPPHPVAAKHAHAKSAPAKSAKPASKSSKPSRPAAKAKPRAPAKSASRKSGKAPAKKGAKKR
jgi:hypothetical protein